MIEKLYYNKKININESLNLIFNSENVVHKALLISKINEDMYDAKKINEVRRYIKKNAKKLKPFKNSLDTCGTGGDGKKTLNISTAVALLLASMGIKISKHGNKAASSKSGSTDVLQELGVKMYSDEENIHKSLNNDNFVYLNAPNFLPDLRHVGEARKLLGFKTFFNLIGPTLNPLQANFQIIGAFNEKAAKTIAGLLYINKIKNFKVFSSKDGLDEISIFSPTIVFEKSKNKINKKIYNNNNYKKYLTKKSPSFDQIIGKDAKYNANKIIDMFEGKKDSYRDIVVINSIYGLKTIKPNINFEKAYELINNILDNKVSINFLHNITK